MDLVANIAIYKEVQDFEYDDQKESLHIDGRHIPLSKYEILEHTGNSTVDGLLHSDESQTYVIPWYAVDITKHDIQQYLNTL